MRGAAKVAIGCALAAPVVVLGAGLAAILHVARSVDDSLAERLSKRPWDDEDWPVSDATIPSVLWTEDDYITGELPWRSRSGNEQLDALVEGYREYLLQPPWPDAPTGLVDRPASWD